MDTSKLTRAGAAGALSHWRRESQWVRPLRLRLIKPHTILDPAICQVPCYLRQWGGISKLIKENRRKHERHKWKDVANVTGVLRGKQAGILEIIFEDTRSELSKNEKKKVTSHEVLIIPARINTKKITLRHTMIKLKFQKNQRQSKKPKRSQSGGKIQLTTDFSTEGKDMRITSSKCSEKINVNLEYSCKNILQK